jgi:hypothetical protein
LDPATVLYTSCDLNVAFALLRKASEQQNFSLWSMRGDPSSLQFTPHMVALRVGIYNQPVRARTTPPAEAGVGTAHLVKVTPGRTRISLQVEDLAGDPLPASVGDQFEGFCAEYERLLQELDVLMADSETGGRTRVLGVVADTGPLPA